MVVVRRFLRWAVAVMCGCYAFACAAEPVVIEATVEPAEPYIQQQVTYIVRAYVDTRIEFAELAVPLPQGAVTMPLGEDEDKILTRDGVDPRRGIRAPVRVVSANERRGHTARTTRDRNAGRDTETAGSGPVQDW